MAILLFAPVHILQEWSLQARIFVALCGVPYGSHVPFPPLSCFPHSTQLAWQCPHYDSPWSSDSASSHICKYYLLMEKDLSATLCFLAEWDCILKPDGYKGSKDYTKKRHSSCNMEDRNMTYLRRTYSVMSWSDWPDGGRISNSLSLSFQLRAYT